MGYRGGEVGGGKIEGRGEVIDSTVHHDFDKSMHKLRVNNYY